MEKVIRNVWVEEQPGVQRASILRPDVHPEGLEVDRVRFPNAATLKAPAFGQMLSVIRGGVTLRGAADVPLRLEASVHAYLPAGTGCVLEADAGTELARVTAPSAEQSRGKKLIVRDEAFVAACAAGSQSLRWTLTPQYLSRRIFLHHDAALLSKSGHPVSWFHTTMFDVAGLPTNEDGEPVFKMSYNSRTEFNVCYEVPGEARVRMALHPYRGKGQQWSEWLKVDGDATYHLNEAADAKEVEWIADASGARRPYRNKHEVYIREGYCSLFCMFDPAPVGMERHRPGEYSDYQPISDVIGTEEYAQHQREIRRFDEMADSLSMAKARGELATCFGTSTWELYLRGRETQVEIEKRLIAALVKEGAGREKILARWLQPAERLL